MEKLLANGYLQVASDDPRRAVYWVAAAGNVLAVIPPDAGQSCIASVEHDMGALFGCRGASWGDLYVIWQPKNPAPAVWARWEKKWSARTRGGTA